MIVALLSQSIQPLLDDEDFVKALDISLQMVYRDDFQPFLVTNLLQIYLAATNKMQSRQRTKEVKSAVDGWLSRAAALIAAPEDEQDQLQRPTEADLQTVRDAVEEMNATLQSAGL